MAAKLMAAKPKSCKSCGGPIPTEATTGRPRSYCSTACKRTCEHEVKRIDRRIELLEAHLSGLRVGWGWPTNPKPIEAEIARLNGRLRELLAE